MAIFEPVSLLDFGFLSMVGDPAFDASVASAIFDMYGPKSRQSDEQVADAVCQALGHRRNMLLAYRALYALLTSNAYSADGSDGHFRWYVEMLRRQDVRKALGL